MSTVRARHGARQLPCPHDHKPVLERKRPVRKATEHFPGKETHLFPIKRFIQMPLFSGANERCLLSVFNLLQRKLLRLDFFLHSLSLSLFCRLEIGCCVGEVFMPQWVARVTSQMLSWIGE